jgi:cobalt-zinc-cadmium resistance protein CzcA
LDIEIAPPISPGTLLRIIANVPDVTGIVARTGSDELGLDPMGPNQTDTFLVLKPADQRQTADKPALMQQLRQTLAQFPGLSFGFTQPIDMRVQEMISGVRGDVAVKIFGPDIVKLNELASRLASILSHTDGARTCTRPSTKEPSITPSP